MKLYADGDIASGVLENLSLWWVVVIIMSTEIKKDKNKTCEGGNWKASKYIIKRLEDLLMDILY